MDPAPQAQMRNDFAQYTDSDGLLTPSYHPGINSTGNGILYTAFYYMTLCQWSVINATDKQSFVTTIQACRANQINGLYNRSPEALNNQEGPDDYYGLASGAGQSYANVQMASDILTYGQSTSYLGIFHYIYNNVNPGQFTLQSWMGRQFQLVAHFLFCNGKTPALWRRIWWCLSILFSSTKNPNGANDIILTWCQAAAMNDKRFFICHWFRNQWKKRLLKNYPQGMAQVFAIYFNNPNHPLALWFQTVFPDEMAGFVPTKSVSSTTSPLR